MKIMRRIFLLILFGLVVSATVSALDLSVNEGSSGLIVGVIVVVGLSVLNMFGAKDGALATLLRSIRTFTMSPSEVNAEVDRIAIKIAMSDGLADLCGDIAEVLYHRLPDASASTRAERLASLKSEVKREVIRDISMASPEDAREVLGATTSKAVATLQNRINLATRLMASDSVDRSLSQIAGNIMDVHS